MESVTQSFRNKSKTMSVQQSSESMETEEVPERCQRTMVGLGLRCRPRCNFSHTRGAAYTWINYITAGFTIGCCTINSGCYPLQQGCWRDLGQRQHQQVYADQHAQHADADNGTNYREADDRLRRTVLCLPHELRTRDQDGEDGQGRTTRDPFCDWCNYEGRWGEVCDLSTSRTS